MLATKYIFLVLPKIIIMSETEVLEEGVGVKNDQQNGKNGLATA